jgi:hypothetical protein
MEPIDPIAFWGSQPRLPGINPQVPACNCGPQEMPTGLKMSQRSNCQLPFTSLNPTCIDTKLIGLCFHIFHTQTLRCSDIFGSNQWNSWNLHSKMLLGFMDVHPQISRIFGYKKTLNITKIIEKYKILLSIFSLSF